MAQEPEPWIERTLREAVEAGEFDDLPGRGRPIADIDLPYDSDWWVRRWWQRHRAHERAAVVAAEVQRRLPGVMAQRDESAVRDGLGSLNALIGSVEPEGDAALEPLPIDDLVAGWRRRRSAHPPSRR